MPTDPRRGREQRLISRCRVELDHRSGPSEGETEDVSLSGLYVRTETVLPVGDETDLRLHLPDGSVVALYARIAHVLTPDAARAVGRHAGIGLELISADTPARAKLIEHLEALPRPSVGGLSTQTQVIVAEPSLPLRGRMIRCLEAAGFVVHPVASAMEAIDACNSMTPDAIVAASDMTGMTGVDLAYAMSEHSVLSTVPLVLTGGDGDHGRLEAFRAGVRDYIPVPFLDEELVIRVHRIAAPAYASSPGLPGSL
ncbi:MAG TPA: response regulator, partial [Kofleriaceae bacterium]